ncbi:MAG TPA: methyltransferase domain-containing protein, partial [Candidatus Limnocylindria bacterium]|nr:methyltransferase domain-containing protein [Candidatus Limnocylindria bacterium]
MKIDYQHTDIAWQGYDAFLRQLILDTGARRICEIGGGANPAIPIDFVQQHGLDYLIVDISAEELAKAPTGYRTQVVDIARAGAAPAADCDLVFSKMLAEHVQDAAAFHQNCFALLRPGGRAFHFFPTLWAPPFVVNLLLPERLSYWILNRVQKGREKSGRMSKFPAYYQWCRGPIQSQLRRLQSVGFEIERYIGFFGHDGYYARFPLLPKLHRKVTAFCQRNRLAALTSF